MATSYPNPATPEEIWAMMREFREDMKKSREEREEVDRRMREEHDRRMREHDRQMREHDRRMREFNEGMERLREKGERFREEQEKTDRQMKEVTVQMKATEKTMGNLHNRFGELAEHLVAPGIHARFNEMGYFFGEVSPGGHKIYGEDGKLKAEIDILLENGETVMAVEVKAKVMKGDLEDFIERLGILREHRDKKNDRRKIQGAVAGAIFGSAQKREVIRAGLFVIEQTGDTMKIDVPDGFAPREW